MASRYGDEFRGRGRDRSRERGYSGSGGDRGYGGRSGGGGYGRDRAGSRRGEQSGGGAEHLARIHGTEEDRVNCPFYFKIGACRHGDRCSRLHNKPVFSQTILVSHMYQNPIAQVIAQNGDPASLDQRQVDEDFEDFYEEVFEELCKFGKVEELNICDNLGDHLVGNVYAKYEDEEHAAAAQKSLYGRFYAGRPLVCEFSPVTDFREARCRQFDEGTCNRGGYCNFMHIKTVSRSMQRELERMFNRGKRDKSRSRSRSKSRSRSASRGRGRQSRGRSRSRSGSHDAPKAESSRRKGSRSCSPSPAKKDRRSRSRSHSPRSPVRGSKRDTARTEGDAVEKKD
ncbi:splicing factor U2AF 35 kDa subunit [Phytophthora infestans T30-4]|uniref:Splicing factor U2AF 35 kDa subunit n=2 Tax=Phytophthora infestans TaxID=4787 RepID=D0N3G1_PHYIT|nr:splicing factor U2AF 35 kDa subunit [Phytophthora infestans T30-4]EEY69453.1 splicing factor U2AF 35 kDa subunit [Phytophthora infestans T30-4]KAF4042300.1 Zinc finger C-x8-C-x5-C-x3-H type (and similar) [Phytophthora infestans]KAF4138049.1 Zinc finger C-x8-C-x5-C-x3-H type (and similar) [Phytophthora infestans]KAI9997012.1 hypothetical protein PInf_000445 [Phytophthora infestans]|eukprot:XP_002999307.1 splicing factor U2AF 35 kDa subunit [Phytophthora infestans T30-4]